MYSPFYGANGKALEINKIQFKHLDQLKECEEGHHLEFKRLLEDGGKNQLSKEITSFANCEGGWLIVGIDDQTKDIVPIDCFDYSQKVGKIVSRVSPMPEFETKFLRLPDNKSKGVLVIYVYEGKNAPYICDGSIYIRCGSNKEPIKSADRGNVEYLINRSHLYELETESFFRRDYYFPYSNIFRKVTYPIIDVYLKNISEKKDKWLMKFSNRDKICDYVLNNYPIFEHYQFTMDSIVFCHKQILPGNSMVTMAFELFYDWSCKIYFPMAEFDKEEAEDIRKFYSEIGFSHVEKINLINAGIVCNTLRCFMQLFDSIAKKHKLREKDYAFCTEIENAGETVMFFSCEKYKDYVRKRGLPYASKEINRSKIYYLKDYPKVTFAALERSVINDFVGPAYGFESDIIIEMSIEDNMKYEDGDKK